MIVQFSKDFKIKNFRAAMFLLYITFLVLYNFSISHILLKMLLNLQKLIKTRLIWLKIYWKSLWL